MSIAICTELVLPLERGNPMSTFGPTDEHHMTEADLTVAKAMGNDLKAVAQMKYRHGKGGLAGVALFANAPGSEPFPAGPRAKSPYPNAPDWKPLKSGDETDELLRKKVVVAPENSDDEDLPGIGRPVRTIGVTFPSGETNVTLRAARKEK
jgi:hypothetical protein